MIDNFNESAKPNDAPGPESFSDRLAGAFDRPLETERLIIKPWEKSEAARITNFFNADDNAFPAFMRWWTGVVYEENYIINTAWDYFNGGWQPGSQFNLFAYKKDTGEIIGCLPFYQDEDERNRLSYFILPSARGKGYAREAHAACLNWIQQKNLFREMHAQVYPDNIASRKLLLANGFSETGTEFDKRENAMQVIFNRKFPVSVPAPKPQAPGQTPV